MLTYADGSALSRVLAADPESASWLRWYAVHADDVVTSPLGLTELRRSALGTDAVARATAYELAEQVTVVRFFDQAFRPASMASAVLDPFRAMHLGIVVAHPDIGRLATYDPLLARVASIYDVRVVTPGRPDGWWDG
ncbi:PIN domain-containing protein [Actinotalea sp. Marseille-Q4924]|uniref:PIN domain-containing protein n=1 Tax=Actinotalea sp. Marseille-Q4924 TaxID=2866571 RepID=UPI001CE40E91|nr:PIN domain-containing protein [Actinotalea sp. Marseille-Q4924]